MATVTILDESTLGDKHIWSLEVQDLLNETMTLRELIRRRIFQEVAECNARHSVRFRGLVRPTDAETALNGQHRRGDDRLDWQVQYEKAVEIFGRRGYIVLVNDNQVTDLDAALDLVAGTEVTFLRLVPLVGG